MGRLGTCVDGRPYVVPLSFAYRHGRILFHGAVEGKKMREIARNPRVCFEVDVAELLPSEDPCNYSFRYRSVIADGTARVIEDEGERIEGLKLIVEKYAPGMGDRITGETVERFKNMAVVEIKIEEMVGKKSPA